MVIDLIGRKGLAALAFAVFALAAGCAPDCEELTCGEWCEGFSEPSDPDLTFQVCVANASSTSGDFILRDADGEEVYSCEAEYDELGQEVGSCSLDFAGAKLDYCGCNSLSSTYGY